MTAWLTACHEFRSVDANGVCGNGVLEPLAGEDCDTFGALEGTQCGATSTRAACRYVCDDAIACPGGWQCGGDGVCRAPSAQLDRPTIVSVPGRRIGAADFDGDNVTDLISFGGNAIAIAFGANEAALLNVASAPSPPPDIAPVVRDIDEDGNVELVVPTQDGLQLYRGSPTRELIPVVQPLSTLPVSDLKSVPVRAVSPYRFDDTLLIKNVDDVVSLEVQNRPTDASALDFLLSANAGLPLARLAVAELDGDDSASEVALAFDEFNEVVVATVDCAPPGCVLGVRNIIETPAGCTLDADGGTFIDDFDADGHLDVMSVLREDGPPIVGIARGDGAGNFLPMERRPEMAAAVACFPCPAGVDMGLLGVKDITGDGRADFLTRTGAVRNIPPGEVLPPPPPGPPQAPGTLVRAFRPWADAEARDLNGDDRVDVVGVRPGAIDILVATPDGLFNQHEARIDISPRFVDLGDFDGDLRVDVAVADNFGRVVALFSGDGDLPSVPVLMAQLPSAVQMARMREQGRASDGIDDLFISTVVDQQTLIARLDGRGARRMIAPVGKVGGVYAQATSGRFRAPDQVDTFWIEIANGPPPPEGGRPPRVHAYRVADGGIAQALAPPAPLRLTVDPDSECVLPTRIGVHLAAADLDGDGIDEIVMLETFSPEPPEGNEVAIPEAWPLWVLRIDGDILRCELQSAVPAQSSPQSLHIVDLDGDGHLDAVTALDRSSFRTPDLVGRGESALAVWWGDAQGRFEPAPQVFKMGDGQILALLISTAELDGNSGKEIVALTDGQLLSVSLRARTLLQAPIGDAVPSSAALIVADVNADGLDDVLVGTDSAVFAFPQRACTAEEAATGACVRREPTP